MKVSLIMPVKNEEISIARVLDCILNQTLLPDEIIIADGGSTDKTVEIAKRYTDKLPLKIIQIGPAFPGKGRNAAIKEARGPIIAMTDAGLTLKPDWLTNLVMPFEKDNKVDVVFGGFEPKCLNKFMEATALFVASDKNPKHSFRFPIMQSIAIKKEVYEAIGGCPAELRATEDAVFFRKLFEKNIKYVVAVDAVVDWEMDDSWRYLIRKNYQAAKYEILGGYIRKRSLFLMALYPFMLLMAYAGIIISPVLAFVAPVLFGIRVTGSKRMDAELFDSLVSSLSGIVWLALVTLVADISHIAGNLTGFFSHIKAHDKLKLRIWRGARFQC